MATNVSEVKKIIKLQRAVECLAEQKSAKKPEPLFDRFWAEGELALLFGHSGVGKSLLAVQIADAIARGTPLAGFEMAESRKKVLYIDLSLSDAQFHARYGSYEMARNLFRGRPDNDEDIFEWIEAAAEQHGLRAVVVDDLSSALTSRFNIRQMTDMMRKLKRLCHRKNISVLAVTDSPPPRNYRESETDLGNARVICRFADSVFSLARIKYGLHEARLVQIRSRSGELFWNHENAPECSIKHLDNGMLGMEFDKRFAPNFDEERLELIRRVYWRHKQGSSFRIIGLELGISKTLAHRLCKKWTPALGGSEEYEKSAGYNDGAEPEPRNRDETEARKTEREEELGEGSGEINAAESSIETDGRIGEGRSGEDMNTHNTPSIYDLEQDFDGYGTIYVESREEHSGKPAVWYKRGRNGTIYRSTRKSNGIFIDAISDQLSESQTFNLFRT